jgi:hypothetical protein
MAMTFMSDLLVFRVETSDDDESWCATPVSGIGENDILGVIHAKTSLRRCLTKTTAISAG